MLNFAHLKTLFTSLFENEVKSGAAVLDRYEKSPVGANWITLTHIQPFRHPSELSEQVQFEQIRDWLF